MKNTKEKWTKTEENLRNGITCRNNADKLNRYLRISLRFENAFCVCYLYRCAHKQAYVKYSDCTGGFNVQFIWNQVNETMGKEN